MRASSMALRLEQINVSSISDARASDRLRKEHPTGLQKAYWGEKGGTLNKFGSGLNVRQFKKWSVKVSVLVVCSKKTGVLASSALTATVSVTPPAVYFQTLTVMWSMTEGPAKVACATHAHIV